MFYKNPNCPPRFKFPRVSTELGKGDGSGGSWECMSLHWSYDFAYDKWCGRGLRHDNTWERMRGELTPRHINGWSANRGTYLGHSCYLSTDGVRQYWHFGRSERWKQYKKF